jgi:AmmeMemoRadiSam system protein A
MIGFGFKRQPVATCPTGSPHRVAANEFSKEDREFLLRLAREALQSVAARCDYAPVGDIPAQLLEPRACFVTLRKAGRLRGCIGNIFPKSPLVEAVISNTVAAATRDSRFAPMDGSEEPFIEVELSILSYPVPVEFATEEELLHKLRPGVDGVVLRIGNANSTFLPKVWEQLPDPREFLGQLSRKAGLDSDAWRGEDVGISVYQAETFSEAAY